MNKRQALISTAVSGLFAAAAMTAATQTFAQDEPEMEHCYGVVKAGKNDCAGPGHTCQGQAKTDASPQEYILVPAGTCERLVNGSTTPRSE